MEELKAIKQWKSDVMEGFCKYDASSFEEIVVNARAKAIDEFADSIKTELDRFGVVNLDTCVLYDFIDRKAERLKAGGVDG